MTDDKLFDGLRLWVSPVDLPGGALYLMYNGNESFAPLTDAGDIEDTLQRWCRLSEIHYNTWHRLTAEQQQKLADHAKVLVVSRRLGG